jgi:hypothetical protein
MQFSSGWVYHKYSMTQNKYKGKTIVSVSQTSFSLFKGGRMVSFFHGAMVSRYGTLKINKAIRSEYGFRYNGGMISYP